MTRKPEWIDDIIEKAGEIAWDVMDKAPEVLEKVRSVAAWAQDKFVDAVGWAKERIGDAFEHVKEYLDDDSGAEEISETSAHDAQNASIDQSRQIDQILQREREKRKKYIERTDEGIQEIRGKSLNLSRKASLNFKAMGLKLTIQS